jgi:hypothetical protein
MSKLIETLETQKQKKLIDEHMEGQSVKTSVSISKNNMAFIDALAQYYETTRTAVISAEMGFAIEAALIVTDKKELIQILEIAAKKSSQWEVALREVKDRPEMLKDDE